MAQRDFSELVETGLLKDVEGIVVAAHRGLHVRQGRPWSPPDAYKWLHYEDPEPVERLADGVRRLRRRGARFDVAAVDKACARASKAGHLN